MNRYFLSRVLRGALVLPALLLAVNPSSADVAQKKPAPVAPSKSVPKTIKAPPDMVRITEFKLTPPMPKEGDTVTASLTIKNEVEFAMKNLRYTLAAGSTRDGTIPNLPPWASTTVTNTFVVSAGTLSMLGIVDPQNQYKESGERLKNNSVRLVTQVVTDPTADWTSWATKASQKFQDMINLYKQEVSVSGTINGSNLTVNRLNVGSNASTNSCKNLLTGQGIPADVGQAMAEAFDRAFRDWASNYRAVIPWAYPAFLSYPSSRAGPLDNVPFSLAMGGSTASIQALQPSTIESRLRQRLSPSRLALRNSSQALEAFGRALYGRFTAWIPMTTVMRCSGEGPVPGFAPPFSMFGPVVNGSVRYGTHQLF